MTASDAETRALHSADSEAVNTEPGTARWQYMLLPLMSGMLVVLTAVFVVTSLIQVFRIQDRIEQVGSNIPSIANGIRPGDETRFALDEARWRAAVLLEENALNRRYQQASLIMMSRVWIIYLGFVTGMTLALVGAAFILGKLREPTSQLEADSSVWKFSVTTASPGIVLAVLGTVLMISTMLLRADVSVNDAPVYLAPDVRLTTNSHGGTLGRPANPPAQGRSVTTGTPDDSSLDDLDREAARRSGNDGAN
mgnify:CR=1 FL=1